MQREHALNKIRKVIEKSEDLDPLIPLKDISYETKFSEDLGFDSLALMSILYELQEENPNINESEINNWKTLNNCVESFLQ